MIDQICHSNNLFYSLKFFAKKDYSSKNDNFSKDVRFREDSRRRSWTSMNAERTALNGHFREDAHGRWVDAQPTFEDAVEIW